MILIMCWYMKSTQFADLKEYQIVEFYAGQARISRLGKAIGLCCCAHDVTYDKGKSVEESAMNINGSAGFLLRPELLLGLSC